MTATDLRPLLLGVLQNPADDAPRLVYADAVEEAGRPEHAEFIRLQVAGDTDCLEFMYSCDECGFIGIGLECAPCRRRGRLVDLWATHGHTFAPDLPGGPMIARPDCRLTAGKVPTFEYSFKRGFVHTVRAPLRAILHNAQRIWDGQPVGRVEVTDYPLPTPVTGGEGRTVYGFTPLVGEIWDLMDAPELVEEDHGHMGDELYKAWPTREAAVAGFSAALVEYGRRAAGLEAL